MASKPSIFCPQGIIGQLLAIPKDAKLKIKKALASFFNITENTIYNDPIGFAMANSKLKSVDFEVKE